MNAPNDLRWIMFAPVPVHANVDVVTPMARGIVWLYRRAGAHVRRQVLRRAAENIAA